MTIGLDFWLELASPYTYLAASRIDACAREQGVSVRWRPFLLGPVFAASGWSDSPFNVYPAKGRYMWRDVAREAEILGLPFRRPSVFPRNTVLATRVAGVGVQRPWGPDFVRAVMKANFADDRDVASASVIDEILGELGLDGAALREEAAAPPHRGALREATEEAMQLGIFGAPTFMVGGEMFWGNDRLERALAWATGVSM